MKTLLIVFAFLGCAPATPDDKFLVADTITNGEITPFVIQSNGRVGLDCQHPNSILVIMDGESLIVQSNATPGLGVGFVRGFVNKCFNPQPDASLEITNDGAGDDFIVEDSIDANTEPIMIRTIGGVWLNTLGGGIAHGIVDLWD